MEIWYISMNKHYAFSSSKHLWQYHLTYFSLKGFYVCARTFCETTHNIRRILAFVYQIIYYQILSKAFCSYKIKQWKCFSGYIFNDFYHYVEIGIVHFRLDSSVSAFSFWNCQNLLQRVFSFLIKCNE